VLLAGKNPKEVIENLRGILSQRQLTLIQRAVDTNVRQLFVLGESHFNFAISAQQSEWRQIVSRLYYAAYNIRRAVSLKHSGQFSTDSSDHKNIGEIPDAFNNASTYKNKLKTLRDDRNLADYSHVAIESDLVIPIADAKAFVTAFISDARIFLKGQGLRV
jgi:hypothetical protein